VNANYPRFVIAWLVSISAACTSAPIRYYTLIPPPDQPLQALEATLAIDVRVAHIPPELNRSELMVRTGRTETTLLENERWASPMKEEIKAAVRLELQRRLGGMSGLPSSFTKLALDVDVQRLEAELGQYALLEASWRAILSGAGQPPSGARVMTCTFRADEKIDSGYAAMVEGYQREIAALAEAIVAVLRSSAAAVDAPCPTSPRSAGESGSKGRLGFTNKG
jgi:uncharacterized lipoprotein YmbA